MNNTHLHNPPAIELKGLTKHYKDVLTVNSLNLSVRSGEIYGFLGRNGAGKLSLGNKQRLALARALIGSPKLLVLDEPANALDPAGIVEIRELLKFLAGEQGITVFVSSHILGEVAQLADRIGIIHRGKLIKEFDVADRANSDKPKGYRIETDDRDRAENVLTKLVGLEELKRETDTDYLLLSGSSIDPAAAAAALSEAGIGLKALIPVIEDLESYFLKITGE